MQFWRDSMSLYSSTYHHIYTCIRYNNPLLRNSIWYLYTFPQNFAAHFQEVMTLHLLQNCMHYFKWHETCWGLYSAIYFQRLFFVLVPVVTACLLYPVMSGMWVDVVALPVTRCIFKAALQNVKYPNIKTLNHACEVSHFHSRGYEEYCLLEGDTMQSSRNATFGRTLQLQ
jgi:hypothetical protein